MKRNTIRYAVNVMLFNNNFLIGLEKEHFMLQIIPIKLPHYMITIIKTSWINSFC